MKIAFLNITQGLAERGAETFVREVSERLKKRHEVEVISGDKLPPGKWPVLWRVFIDPYSLSVFWFTLKNLPRIWREKFNVVVPLNGGWQPALLRLATWLYGGKMIISGQSGKGWDDRNNLWSFPDAFVALSTLLKNWAKGVNPLVRVEYIPNGVDTQKFKPDGMSENFNLPRPIILCVGALTREKRIDLAIKAVSHLKHGSLVVIGHGPLKDELQELGKKLLGKRFLLRESSFEKLPQFYRSADLFTIPSPWYRSFEIVIVEAMATNLPVVVNDDPIRKEIVDGGGLSVNPTDTEAYARAIENALQKSWGSRPRRQAEKFSWDDIAKKYERLFEGLIK